MSRIASPKHKLNYIHVIHVISLAMALWQWHAIISKR